MFVVEFKNVGRHDQSWTAHLEKVDHDSLLEEVKTHGKLMSSIIKFAWNTDRSAGSVMVGFFDRTVGQFDVTGMASEGSTRSDSD